MDSKEYVNEFVGKFIMSVKEIEEFNCYLDSRDLWEIVEIFLLFLMFCLIWMDRYKKVLLKLWFNLYERFVEILLLYMVIKNLKSVNDVLLYNIFDDFWEDLSKIGKLVLDGFLRDVFYIDVKDVSF